MNPLLKLNVIVGCLVLLLAVVLGIVIAEFPGAADRTNSRKPPGREPVPAEKPSMNSPLGPALPPLRTHRTEWS